MPNPIDIHIGARIMMARQIAGNLTQDALGKAIGVTFQQVQKYEKGTNRVSGSRLVMIARHLGQPVAWFFEGIDAPETSRGTLGSIEPVPGAHELFGIFARLCAADRRMLTAIALRFESAAANEREALCEAS